ncbi:MAG TPA: hypothetical protein VGR30_06305 [Candidatus Binatia bacterium]|jgi:hypothetical protein|nr:hypothetical protein [Candidatus Binatia bacterium]
MDEAWLIGAPFLLVMLGAILFLFSRVEQPIGSAEIREHPDEALLRLVEAVKRARFPIKELDPIGRRLRINAVRKILDLVLYRCWSKELIFHVGGDKRLLVAGKPSPWRAYATATTLYLMTDQTTQ